MRVHVCLWGVLVGMEERSYGEMWVHVGALGTHEWGRGDSMPFNSFSMGAVG